MIFESAENGDDHLAQTLMAAAERQYTPTPGPETGNGETVSRGQS